MTFFHSVKILILLILVSVPSVWAEDCLKVGSVLEGRLTEGRHSHPNGSSFEIFILSTKHENCYVIDEKIKSELIPEVQLAPEDKQTELFQQLDKSYVVLQANSYIEEETAWHVRPVVAFNLNLKTVDVGSVCDANPKPLEFKSKDSKKSEVISKGRTYLYSKPLMKCKSKVFIVQKNAVERFESQGEFSLVEYKSDAGTKFRGWIESAKLK